MGLFNSGKNEKVEKVSKYERHYNVPQHSSRRHSSKGRPHQGENGARAMSQPPVMRMGGGGGGGGGGYYPPPAIFNPGVLGGMPSNVMPHGRYPMLPYDLSKYASATPYSGNPFGGVGQMNFPPVWNNGMALVNQRSAFQQAMNDFQQGGWPAVLPSNYPYMPQMQF